MTQRRATTVALIAVITVLYAYNVQRHYFLGDDCFISFRYARNYVDGHGLVWNPGERVEGYTNFLWVMLMALVMAVGGSPELASNALGIASGAGILGIVAWMGARWWSWEDPRIWIAPAFLAVSRTFTAWSTGGLATQFFTLLVTAGIAAFVWERDRDEQPVVSSVLITLATLTRPEGGIFMFGLGCFFLGEVVLRRRPLHQLVLWCVPWIAVVGTHFVWRYNYYGYWLPNTFYAKVNGAWWQHAWKWFGLFLIDYKFVWYGWLLLVPIVLRRRAEDVLLTGLLLLHLAYLTYVGGDRFEFRLLEFVLPIGYVLLAVGLDEILRRIPAKDTVRAGVTTAIVAALLGVTWYYPTLTEDSGPRKGTASIGSIASYAKRRIREGQFFRKVIDAGLVPADVRIATPGAGALPYYANVYTIDYRGLNDEKIGHKEVQRRGRIGHEKHASLEYLIAKGVQMFDIKAQGFAVGQFAAPPARARAEMKKRTKNRPRLTVKCLKALGGHLYFATPLDEEAAEELFGELEPCNMREAPAPKPRKRVIAARKKAKEGGKAKAKTKSKKKAKGKKRKKRKGKKSR